MDIYKNQTMELKKLILLLISILGVISCMKSQTKTIIYNYPKIEKQSVTEEYCGINITDDYRNLENLQDSTVIKWFKKQETYAENILNKIKGRDDLFDKMKDYETRNDYETYWIKVLPNGNHFFLKHYAKDNAPMVYMKSSKENQEEFLFDPKEYNKETGKKFIIRDYEPSWDGKKLAIALTYDGKEFGEVVIIDIDSKKILIEKIPNFWGGLKWLPDNSGISFLALDENFEESDDHFKNMNSIIYKLENPTNGKIIFSKKNNPELKMTTSDIPNVSYYNQTDEYAIGWISGATAYHDAYFCKSTDLFNQKKANWSPLAKKEHKVEKIRINKSSLIATTALFNDSFQIVKGNLQNIDWNQMEVLVTPKHGEVINDFEITSNGIFYTTLLNGVKAKLYHFQNGESREIKLPIDAGYAIIDNLSPNHSDLWVRTMGWLNNYKRFRYDFEKQKFFEEEMSLVTDYPEFQNFVVREIEVIAHDGEKIPLSIIHKKELKKNGNNPTLMIGYGSYGISYEPFFSTNWLTWVEYGGVLAIAHVRGGGEKGNAWYEGGKKKTKPNTWKDMISCTEYMIKEKFTSKKKTIIQGSSAGGITVGRAITERPDLYAAAIARVGSLNTLRSEDAPNGDNNVKEFGSYKNPDECLALLEMDSYTKIKEGVKYPATIKTAAWSPGKFAARLQEKNSSNKPIIFYVQTNSGHGLGEGKWDSLKKKANLFAFAFWQVNHDGFILTNN